MLTETRNNFDASKFKTTTGCPLQQKWQLLVLLAPKAVKVEKEHTVAKITNNQFVLLMCIRLTSTVLISGGRAENRTACKHFPFVLHRKLSFWTHTRTLNLRSALCWQFHFHVQERRD